MQRGCTREMHMLIAKRNYKALGMLRYCLNRAVYGNYQREILLEALLACIIVERLCVLAYILRCRVRLRR